MVVLRCQGMNEALPQTFIPSTIVAALLTKLIHITMIFIFVVSVLFSG